MKTFKRQAAQGDLLIMRLSDDFVIPENYKEVKAEDGKYIVAHSETGHHHTVLERSTTYFQDPEDAFNAILSVKEKTPLTHERSYDTHETLGLEAGNYKIRRQREYTPEGYRRVAD